MTSDLSYSSHMTTSRLQKCSSLHFNWSTNLNYINLETKINLRSLIWTQLLIIRWQTVGVAHWHLARWSSWHLSTICLFSVLAFPPFKRTHIDDYHSNRTVRFGFCPWFSYSLVSTLPEETDWRSSITSVWGLLGQTAVRRDGSQSCSLPQTHRRVWK